MATDARPVIAVVGATASGKSELAVALARRLGGEVINTDAMQLYRGMDIGTAKLTRGERRGVPHHLLDVLDVVEPASVAVFQSWVRCTVGAVLAHGAIPVLAGGSGLYVRAAIDEMQFPGTDAAIRARLEHQAAQIGTPAMHARLRQVDPVAAAAILPSNTRRVVRALEVIELTGKPYAATLPTPTYWHRPTVQVALDVPRDELDRRVEARVERMWARGLVDEVRALAENGLAAGPTASRALGYAQVLRFLAGEWSEQQAQERTIVATRRFIRRQDQWFRKDPRVQWVDPGADPVGAVLQMVSDAAPDPHETVPQLPSAR
jgi:tRNA dimethylallyltransferase